MGHAGVSSREEGGGKAVSLGGRLENSLANLRTSLLKLVY
jgi:hypothetical protein